MPSNDRGSKTVGFGRPLRWSLSARKTAGASSVTRVLFLLTLGTLFSLIGQTSVAPQAHGLYFGTGYNAAVAVMLVAEIKTVLTHVQLTWLLWVSASL